MRVVLKNGFEVDVNEEIMDNMELVDVLAEADGDDPIALSKMCNLIFGQDKKKELYNHVRTKDGRVPMVDITNAIHEVFNAFGEKGKNS